MNARRKTALRLSEDVREGFARVAAKPFGGKPSFGAEEGGGGNPFAGKAPGTPTKRDIPKDHEFDKKAVKPIVKTLWAMSVALGHALTAHRAFSRLKSSTFSPDGLLGGRGYVLPVKDVRADLFEACEKLSALCDTLHDEINAPHWKPKIAELEKADMAEVERLLGDSEEWIDNPDGEADEEMESVEKKPWTKNKKKRFEDKHEFRSGMPDGGDAETVPSQGSHPASPSHPENPQNKQASVRMAYDPSILGLRPDEIAGMELEEKQDACIDSLMRAADLTEAVYRAFHDVIPNDSLPSVLHAAKDLGQVGRRMIHTKTASYSYDFTANSTLSPQNEPGGPRVQHLDRGDSDQTGPGGSYNRDEKPVADQWGEQGGVSGEPMSQDSGNSYIYPSDWSGDTSTKEAGDYQYGASGMPSDSTPSQGWDFGIGEGNGNDAHGQGAGGYGLSNPGSPDSNPDGGTGNMGVYGPQAELPNDPGGKTHDKEESDSNPIIERSVSESGHMGLPSTASMKIPGVGLSKGGYLRSIVRKVQACGCSGPAPVPESSYEAVPDSNGMLVAVDHAELPNDTDEPVARSDYYQGEKGNDFNGIIHQATEGAAELPGGGTPQKQAPLTARPSHLGEHEFAASGELPGDETSDLYDYGKDGGPGLMDRVEQGNQPYVKWDDNTHEMRPDYTYQRDPIQGPYPKQEP